MKKLMHIAVVFALASAAFGEDIPDPKEQDIRTVNGKEVDLAPLHQWYAKKVGERPLKHWKRVVIKEVQDYSRNWLECLCETEAGETRMLIADLPREISSRFTAFRSLYATVKAETERLDKIASDISQEYANYRRAETVTPTSAGGDPAYVDSVMAERKRINLWGIDIEDRKGRLEKDLAKLKTQHRELDALRSQTKSVAVFAMFTGNIFTGKPQWATGMKATQ